MRGRLLRSEISYDSANESGRSMGCVRDMGHFDTRNYDGVVDLHDWFGIRHGPRILVWTGLIGSFGLHWFSMANLCSVCFSLDEIIVYCTQGHKYELFFRLLSYTSCALKYSYCKDPLNLSW